MYTMKSEWAGYNKAEAEQKRDEIIEAGGVAYLQYLEGMEMGSGPHFQGYQLYYIEPDDLRQHVEEPSRIAGLA